MGWAVNATPRPFNPRERPGTHCIRGWVDPSAGGDGCGKSRLPPGLDPRTVQPVASPMCQLSYSDPRVQAGGNENALSVKPLLHQAFRTQERGSVDYVVEFVGWH